MPPVVNAKNCRACGACAEVCPANVIDIVKEKAVVARPGDCLECRACENVCPNDAISFP